ncbi:SpoIIE family protein phosphatase [Streptomyces sp. NPDC002547]
MVNVRIRPRHPTLLLVIYLGVTYAVQLDPSKGGSVRWSDYSVLAPLMAAALLPPRHTLMIGLSTLAASVAVYGFAIHGISDGGRTILIAAAALSATLGLVLCRTRPFLQHAAHAPAQRTSREDPPDHTAGRTEQTAQQLTVSAGAASSSIDGKPQSILPNPDAVELALRCTAVEGAAGPQAHWIDAIPLPGARVALVASSVTKRGVPAPAIAAELRGAVRMLADIDLQPDELLTRLRELIGQLRPSCDANEDTSGVTASCLYMIYDPISGSCTIACAGHPVPTMVTPDGLVTALELPVGSPLGHADGQVDTVQIELPENSVLLLHTHSPLASANDPGRTTTAALPVALVHPQECLDATCHSALDALLTRQDNPQAAVLAARTRRLGCDTFASWDLPADPAAVSDARKHITERLKAWGLHDAAFTTELIVTELVTNAIRHAQPPVQLRLIRRCTGLICEVSDGSNTSPHLRRAKTLDESGRGLFIVAQLTHRWGTRHSGEGKTIWAEQHHPSTTEDVPDGRDFGEPQLNA